MGNLAGFDADQVPESQFTIMPKALYIGMITEDEFKPTKAGDGEYLNITWEVIDGEFKGRKLWSRLNLKNKNATAVSMAQRELADICKAVGILRPSDTSELHNKPVGLLVGIELDDRKREKNEIHGYEMVGDGTATAPGGAAEKFSDEKPTSGATGYTRAATPAKEPVVSPWNR